MSSSADPFALYRELTALRHIKRFAQHHTAAPESVAEHSFFVAILAAAFARQLRALGVGVDLLTVLEAALWHDVEESVLGDLPHPVKRRRGVLTSAWDCAEADVRQALAALAGGPQAVEQPLPALEAMLVKIADWVELVLYVREEQLCGNHSVDVALYKIMGLLTGELGERMRALPTPSVYSWYLEMLGQLRASNAAVKPLTFGG